MSYGESLDAKERVREAVDLVDVIGSYHPLRRQGRNFVALCPWHNDSRPSLQVNPERQTWKCWVCDIGGDVFSFVMKQENLGFREALELLAERAGVTLPSSRGESNIVAGSPDDKKTLLLAATWAETQFHECLLRSPMADAARRYVEERGITPASVERFHIGFCPEQWNWLIDRAKGTPFSPAVLDAVGLLGKSPDTGRYYERFRGRVIFPIHDVQGRAIAFGGRVLPEFARENVGKYINSPETRLFSKSDNLYALDVARHQLGNHGERSLVVVEGYTDVVMAHQFGVNNVVAVLGTALNERHIRLLKRFADRVILVLDGDEAGQRRTNQVLDLFVAEQVDMRILSLPEEFDPCEFLLERGGEPFVAMLGQAVDALEHKFRAVTQGIDLANDTHAANKALEAMLGTLAKSNYDATDTVARLREQQMVSRLARSFYVPENDLRARLAAIRRTQLASPATPGELPGKATPAPSSAARLAKMPSREIELLETLVLHGELAESVVEEIVAADLSHEWARRIYEQIEQVVLAGETPDFSRLMSRLDDSETQTVLIRIEEQASAKEAHAAEPARARLERLKEDFRAKEAEKERREKQARLEAKGFNQEEEQAVFSQLLASARARHGLLPPTEG